MRSSRQAKRPLLRSRRALLNGDQAGPGCAARLSSLAGLSARPSVELLEPRQMLFSLSVSESDVFDPATGVGWTRAVFGYYLPDLFTDQTIAVAPDNLVEEGLDDEIPPDPRPNPQNVPSGTIFTGSNIRILHNVIPGNNIQIRNNPPPDPDASDRNLRVRLNTGQFFAFQPLTADPDGVGPRTGTRITATSMSFTISAVAPSNIGLNAANMSVQLFYRGVLVRSFTGAELLAAGDTGTGVGRFTFATDNPLSRAFDELRVVANAGPNDAFDLDDIAMTVPQGRFADIVAGGIYGTEVAFVGKVGASVQFFDLYGNDMVQTIVLGRLEGSPVAAVDLNDDGIPDFNYGIGRIVINNGDTSTSLTMFGGLITRSEVDEDTDFAEGGFVYKRTETLNGLYDRMESGGFGFDIDPVNDFVVHGLPPGPGSVIIGAPGPLVRDSSDLDAFNPGGPPTEIGPFGLQTISVPITTGFTRPDQGIFVTGGRSILGVYIHGMLFGSSNFSGAVDRIVVGNLMGSITVNGDLGALIVAGDAGMWQRDDGTPNRINSIRVVGIRPNPGFFGSDAPDDFSDLGVVKTRGQLVVGRTVGEIMIGGRSLLDVTVVGDVNSPLTRPPRDVATYYEKEFVNKGLLEDDEVEDTIINVLGFGFFGIPRSTRVEPTADQGPLFGNQYYRNDFLMSAEWVGSLATGVRIFGDLSALDPVNTGDDDADVFAFASDGKTPISVQMEGGLYFRIVDGLGRTVAAPSGSRSFGEDTRFNFVEYTPDGPGVYYVVVTDPNRDGAETGNGAFVYRLTILGMAPVTLGSYRTAAASGSAESTHSGIDLNNTVTLLSGSAGSLRIGSGRVSGARAEVSAGSITNSADEADDLANWLGGTFSLPGNLYNITTGSDVEGDLISPVTIQVGGNFGTLYTGRSSVAGIGPDDGDLNFFTLSVGGSIALISVSGGSGIDGDGLPGGGGGGEDRITFILDTPGQTRIFSGRSGSKGDIGMIRFGSHVALDSLVVTTSDNSVVGALLVSQDKTMEDNNPEKGIVRSEQGVVFNLGPGSDLRFADFPQIDLRASIDRADLILVGTVYQYVDDGGGLVSIRVVGPAPGVFVGRILTLPVNGSQGVAIGRIEVNLAGGAVLEITTSGQPGNNDVVSIGQIVVTGADGASGINISGNVQTDVFRITTRAAIAFISNSTARGDIVAIDANGLTDLIIGTGSLGRTQVPAWGPALIGPFAGITGGGAGGGGGTTTADTRPGPLPVPAADSGLMDIDWNGELYRGISIAAAQGGDAFLDDVGSPFDPYINGLVVRNGNVNSVRVGGAIGDVIVPSGRITLVSTNDDRVTVKGEFDGIVGTIYGADITEVDIGDGLAQRTNGPLATTGIFAVNDIIRVVRNNSPRADIHSTITAGNSAIDGVIDGIDSITLTGGGDIVDAYISVSNLDAFWFSFNYGDVLIARGVLNFLGGTDADLFKSEIFARDLNTIQLTSGAWDATFASFTGQMGTITATVFRNSTLNGGDLEFHPNVIQGGKDLVLLTTEGQAGDINDLILDINGSITQEISARSMNRVQIEIDNTINLLRVTTDLRASQVNAGQLTRLTAGRNVTASQITIAGPILDITAGNAIVNSEIAATGAFGRIEIITATDQISGLISSSGPIGTVRSISGDIRSKIVTTTSRGNVGSLLAGRDLDVETDISGTLSVIQAGRHIGNRVIPKVIVIRGNLDSATAGGQLYSDLRIGQAVTGVITIGRVSSRPGANELGSGSIYSFGAINAVAIDGDFNGNIISYSGGINTVAINNGSFLPGNTISAFDGSINSVIITAGNLYGNIHADQILYLVQVTADASGTFGDIGINPDFNSNMPFDNFRNALPVGIAAGPAIQGPRITAGWNVGVVYANNGSMFETSIIAGRAIGIIFINGNPAEGNGNVGKDIFTDALANVFTAGDTIYLISVQGDFSYAYVLAGVVDLGSDGKPAGTGPAHDTVKSANLNWLYVAGFSFGAVIGAGADSGADGIYATGDDRIVPGVSFVNNITLVGGAAGIFAISDSFVGAIDGRVVQVGTTLALQDPQVDPGFGIPGVAIPAGNPGSPGAGLFFTHLGSTGAVYFVGPGQAFWDAPGGRVVLRNTTLSTFLTIAVDSPAATPAGTPGTLTNFDIVTNDDASLGAIGIGTVAGGAFLPANLAGDSDVIVDAYLGIFSVGNLSGTGSIKVGENLDAFYSQTFAGGTLSAKSTYIVVISGDYGAVNPFTRGEVKIDILSITGGLLITGADRGAINIDRDLPSMGVLGPMDSATLRAGTSIGFLDAASMSRTLISVRDFFGTLIVRADMFDSSLMVGADLGNDTEFGGVGLAADTVSTGFVVGDISIAGDFRESDVIAGMIRGPDGFIGTSDDSLSEGRSVIGTVTIGGSEVGSDRNSESYRISSTGLLGPVTIGGAPGGRVGNFSVQADVLPPLPFQVTDLQVTQDSRVYTARLFFNQPVNASSLPASLTVSEVRGSGEVEILLVNGVDYTLTYDSATNSAVVEFKRGVTDRDLPQESGVPGPGIYRFRLNQALARAQLINTRLDGNRDGRSPLGDNYSADDFVGDAGDKLEQNTTSVIDPNNGASHRVDFYGPADLNIILDDNRVPDGLPDPNKVFTLRGSIGDHPDNDTNYFRFGGDTDVYRITLQAGQILHIGRVLGPAGLVPVNLFDADGNFVTLSGEGSQATLLPVNPGLFSDLTIEQAFLIKTTGTYFIVASNSFSSFTDPNDVPNLDLTPGTIGDYSFELEVFDDRDSGFSATTDAGNGTDIASPPAPTSFAGPDGVFDTADDLTTITVGQFVYSYSRGLDGIPNTTDDSVFGSDGSGRILSARDGAGVIGAVVDSAIGPTGHFGVPGFVYSDVDIYHLNGRLPIATGTRIKITVRLTDIGADLGSRSQRNLLDPVARGATFFQDFRGSVQFGVFDTSVSTDTEDGLLVFSPTDFKPNGGDPGTIASGENAVYGYDDNGDFFIEFTAPGRQDAPGIPATYAVYLQGVFNTDYRLEIVQSPFNPSVVPTTKIQNVFLETRGGAIDWLQAGGLTTTLRGFDAAQLGFTGAVINGQPVQTYIINQVKARLQAMYNAAGYTVNISTNPADFEFQEFSTIYLSANSDPTSLILSPFNLLFGFGVSFGTASQPFGYTEHSDPLNADSGDDAVVFTPGFALLGYTPTQADVDLFTQSLTAAVGRRIGELMGLRITADYDIDNDTQLDIQAANGVSTPPGPGRTYSVSNVSRLLSDTFDEVERTDFFLGRQNSVSLLDKVLTPR